MNKVYLVALTVAAAVSWTAPAGAHWAPYPHRHAYRRAVAPEARPQPRPRRPVETWDYRMGWYVGGGATGNFVGGGSGIQDLLQKGGGFELVGGFRWSPYAAAEMNWMTTFHDAGAGQGFDRANLSALTFDLKLYLLPRARRFEPYVKLGVGTYFLHRDAFVDPLEGFGFEGGGGVDVRLNPVVSVGAWALYRGAYLDNSQSYYADYPAESALLSMLSLGAGVKLHF